MLNVGYIKLTKCKKPSASNVILRVAPAILICDENSYRGGYPSLSDIRSLWAVD